MFINDIMKLFQRQNKVNLSFQGSDVICVYKNKHYRFRLGNWISIEKKYKEIPKKVLEEFWYHVFNSSDNYQNFEFKYAKKGFWNRDAVNTDYVYNT